MVDPTSPFIKHEPDDMMFLNNPNGFSVPHQYEQGFGSSINPSDLTMNGGFQNGAFGSQSMSSNFMMPNSGITNDELEDLDLNNNNFQDMNGYHGQNQHQGYFDEAQNGMPMNQSQMNNQIYSNTPGGDPIQSPFVHGFDGYGSFRPMPNAHTGFNHAQPTPQSYPNGSFNAKQRLQGLERRASGQRSPNTPKTPAINTLQLGTPESGTFGSQPIHTNQMRPSHQSRPSQQWDGTPGSDTYLASPNLSPHSGPIMQHPQISEVIKSGKHASLPAKVDTSGFPALQSQEAKRRRRRESHNLVERRRRDNINERIQDLAQLVPQHRLEDEKVRKHLLNNTPISPSLAATGMSPPHATSMLAGPGGRRAAGTITTGLPIEDKDRGPNKGDILNGAVGWTRDLMWFCHNLIMREEEHLETIHQLGGNPSIESTEEEKRMRTELMDAFERNNSSRQFEYSRGPGSGLRVPKHTNYAGDAVNANNPLSPQSLSPALQSGGSGANSGQQQMWIHQQSGSSGNSVGFKEEDEYGMTEDMDF